MSNDIIEKILALATQDFRMRLEEAFEAGGAKMRRDLLTALKRDDVSFDVALRGLTDSKGGQDKFGDRAPLGTVRPTIQRFDREIQSRNQRVRNNQAHGIQGE